jgi:hypothetical protein
MLAAVAGPHALRAAEVFREGGQFMKNPRRLIRVLGTTDIVAMRFRLATLVGAMKLVSRRFPLQIRAAVPADGAQAVDVDNAYPCAIAEGVPERRRLPSRNL